MKRCRVCRDVGYVELRAIAMREEDVARVPERERSVRRIESSFLVRAPCACNAGRRWYAVRVTGVEMDRTPKTWTDAVLAVVRGTRVLGFRFKRVERVASAMQLPERFVRAILVKNKREVERHAEEDQEGE